MNDVIKQKVYCSVYNCRYNIKGKCMYKKGIIVIDTVGCCLTKKPKRLI